MPKTRSSIRAREIRDSSVVSFSPHFCVVGVNVLVELIQKMKCETQMLELKSAEQGCPRHLYDTLSGFSNQDEGGVIVFGVDEKRGYKEVGVYDPQDIQKRINEQCLQMKPAVRPLLTIVEKMKNFCGCGNSGNQSGG